MCLEPWWTEHERQWVTFDTEDALTKLSREDVVHAYHPTTRNLRNLVRNAGLAWRVLRDYRPDMVISTGAGVAVPFFWMRRLVGAQTVYLEVFDRIDSPTLTARLCRPVTDLFLVQWPEQQRLYKGSVLLGQVW
ncbi:UDP-N-acetylglucosamine transferase subunit ALG14 [Nocardioides sp. 616]|uniref:UDP-N-acetylglucosamine transferase subunit ALG14 n=1 Tax=Nocardioides sp. 616 TaxID=2268090 RepID=UPI001F056383|nr:UDP-N-acetylglucosamine transferase subunit ALG14 [Nocardioides sp. 616]